MAGREPGSSFPVKHGMLALGQNGWAKLRYGHQDALISAGDLCIIQPFSSITLQETSIDFELLVIRFQEKAQFTSLLKTLFPERLMAQENQMVIKPQPQYQPLVGNVLALLEGISQDDTIPARMELLKDVFTLLSHMMHKSGLFQNELGRNTAKSWKDHLYDAFIAEVSRHYTRSRQVKFYAQLLSISPNYLFKVCQIVARTSPQEIIYRHVIQQSQHLLLHHREMSIKEIAHQMGFTSQAYFGNFFFREVGMRPSEYRGR